MAALVGIPAQTRELGDMMVRRRRVAEQWHEPASTIPWGLPDWAADANCHGLDPDNMILNLNFKNRDLRKQIETALGIAAEYCPDCPVKTECAAWGRKHGDPGVYGGRIINVEHNPRVQLIIRQIRPA